MKRPVSTRARGTRPMAMNRRPKKAPRASTSLKRICCDWDTEAALRMLQNNLDERVALDWKQLIVYGGTGRAARNWQEYHASSPSSNASRMTRPCACNPANRFTSRRHIRTRRASSSPTPTWCRVMPRRNILITSTGMGLMMYGQMTAGSWIYIGTQGILQGTYETFGACGQIDFKSHSLAGKWIYTAGLGNMGSAQPLAGTMNEACILVAEVNPAQIERRLREGYLDRSAATLHEALAIIDEGLITKTPVSVGLLANGATVARQLLDLKRIPDIVTDQTPAHNLMDYVPEGAGL